MSDTLPRYCLLLLLPLFLYGCGTTSAPTESSTKTLDKTVNATLDSTSSSSGNGSDKSAATSQFIRNNYTRIQREIAAGRGEYLTALAVLMQVPASQQDDFFATCKKHYAFLYAPPAHNAEILLGRIIHINADDPTLEQRNMLAASQ